MNIVRISKNKDNCLTLQPLVDFREPEWRVIKPTPQIEAEIQAHLSNEACGRVLGLGGFIDKSALDEARERSRALGSQQLSEALERQVGFADDSFRQ